MPDHIAGVISDTHGFLRPEILEAFKGCDHIVHAGDIGDPHIIDDLSKIAPVTAVRGNCDRDGWAYKIPRTEAIKIGEVYLYVLHDINQLDINVKAAGFDVVICGHSHKPLLEKHDGVIYLNPGSAGPKRFTLPIGAAKLKIEGKSIDVEFIKLSD
ncbi:MAG: uncharacterized protein PWR06_443 [Thermoanaerobacteraceae bacterium]|jgi:hypothetical protein|nr:uncharacterized protein [Thermoanaerobacteraceae bacterium]MDN5301128.1 uncharacterized protein [Thermoanaerobacteraceae bacterium]RKL64509.1 metallophosphoesterase [Thermoanaerobacteraceae bacterium SP2]